MNDKLATAAISQESSDAAEPSTLGPHELHGPPTPPRVRIVGLGPLPFPKMPAPKIVTKPNSEIPNWDDDVTVRRPPGMFALDWEEDEQRTTARDPMFEPSVEIDIEELVSDSIRSTVRELPSLTDTANDATQIMIPPPPTTLVSEPPPVRMSTLPPVALPSFRPVVRAPQESAVPRWWWALASVLLVAACAAAFVLGNLPRDGSLRIELAASGAEGLATPPARTEIFVDGRKRCDTDPCLVEGLSPGVHVVKVIAQGTSAMSDVQVVAREQTTLTLPFAPAAIPTATSAAPARSAAALASATASASAEPARVAAPRVWPRRRPAPPKPTAEEDLYEPDLAPASERPGTALSAVSAAPAP